MEKRLRKLERTLKKDHLKETLALEERFEKLMKEKNMQIQMLQEMLAAPDDESKSRISERFSSRIQDTLDMKNVPLEDVFGSALPDSPLLGATMASQGPILSGHARVDPVGTLIEMDRLFRSTAEVKAFFRDQFAWGPLDQPLRIGKRAYQELMDAFNLSKLHCVHLHFRLVAAAKARLNPDVALAKPFEDLLDALQTAGRPSDFELFVLDCGGAEVVSQVVAGGGVFLLTFPSSPDMLPWHLARAGRKRFISIVNAGEGKPRVREQGGGAEAKMLKCNAQVLEGALSVLLKMHVNITAYPGQVKYTQVPLRSKLFGRVAAVDGAAEFLVEHGWVDDGNKILFQGNGADVDRAVEALERMTEVVAKRKERLCPGMIIQEGGTSHGTVITWDDWRTTSAPFYRNWLFSINHRSRMYPLKIETRELHFFIPIEHPLRQRLRTTVAKGLTFTPPITDLMFVCADDLGGDLLCRIPHGFVPILRQMRADRAVVGEDVDFVSLPSPPRISGHRTHMILCYKTGSTAARLPITNVKMELDTNLSKGDEAVRCLCGLSVPQWSDGYQMLVVRKRGEKPIRGVTLLKPLLTSLPKGFQPVLCESTGEEFNFSNDAVETMVAAVKIE